MGQLPKIKERQNPYRTHLYRRKNRNINKTGKSNKIPHVVVVVYLTLFTDPIRIQLWARDRRSYTKTNRGRTCSEETKQNKKQGRKQKEGSGRESSLQRTSSPGRDLAEQKTNKQKINKSEINKGHPHIVRVGQEKYPPQEATEERQPYKQRKTTQPGRQGQGQRMRHTGK